MPFVSKAQAKWAFATKQPWARKWGHKTRLNAKGGISALPQYVARKGRKWGQRKLLTQKEVPSATPAMGNASGPGGLFSSAALEKPPRSAVTMQTRRPHRIRPERRQRPLITYKEGEGHTGAMIALMLSPEAASTVFGAAAGLFGEKAELAHELHITLAYLGKVTDPDWNGRLTTLVPIIQRYVQTWLETVGMPMIATLEGYSCFPDAKDPETGMIPVFRVVNSPLLRLWVDGLWKVLDFAGVTTHRDYNIYTPHVTIAYTYPEIEELLEVAPAALTPVQFANVTLALGNVHIELPLALNAYKANADDTLHVSTGTKPGKTAPVASASGGGGGLPPGVTRIKGNLCSVHGKFGPCDGASSEGFGKKPKKAKGGGKGKGGKTKPTETERQAKRDADKTARVQEAEAQRVQNRTNALGAMASRPNDKAMEVLDTLAKGGQPDAAMLQSMESTGLVDKHADGSFTLSSGGHSFLNALNKGDPAAANEALARGKDTIANRETQAQDRTKRETERNQARADRDVAKQERQRKLAKRNVERQKKQKPDRKLPVKQERKNRLSSADIQSIIDKSGIHTPNPSGAPGKVR